MDLKEGEEQLSEIKRKVSLGKEKRYEGDNGYEQLINDVQKVQTAVQGIKNPLGDGRKDISEKNKLLGLNEKIDKFLKDVENERDIYEVLQKETTKPLQKIISFVAFSHFAKKSIKRKKLEEIKQKIVSITIPLIEQNLKTIEAISNETEFFCRSKPIFSKMNENAIYGYFGVEEMSHEIGKIRPIVDSLVKLNIEYNYTPIKQSIVNVLKRVEKINEWYRNEEPYENELELDTDSSTTIPIGGTVKNFHFKIKGLSETGTVMGVVDKPEYKGKSTGLEQNARSFFIIGNKTYVATVIKIDKIIVERTEPLDPKHSYQDCRVIIKIEEYSTSIGCDK